MAESSPTGGGGAATSAGILFQQQLGALIVGWLLAQRSFSQQLNLGQAKPVWVRFETEAPVDDILVSTSAGGFVAIQAKTTASLSDDPSSAFGKTISQFVRHWLACRDGDSSLRWNRPLEPQIDRLVLAVGPQAPATIREVLPAALILKSQPGGGELNLAQKRAFVKFEACVKHAWGEATTMTIDPSFARTIAGLVSVFTFDATGLSREAIVEALVGTVTEPADAPTILTGLEAICAELMTQRGGTDLATVRQKLMSRGVKLLPPLDFRGDIDKLRKHSAEIADRLKSYEEIEPVTGTQVSIERECQADILEAALDGALLIIGEPGVGKSGVLNTLARDLRVAGNDVLELAVDRYSVETLEGLKNELGLDHGLIDTLDAWDGPTSGWLIIDALDATRGSSGEVVFRSLIERVIESGKRWNVIASIRTFDLRMGMKFRLLFKGVPPINTLQEQGLEGVRHVRIPHWSQAEFQKLLRLAPSLAEALDNASAPLIDLAMIPFNTRLLSDLVKDGLITVDLSHVASQTQLLALYWEHRVEAHGASARACILRIVQSMVDAGALRARFIDVAGSDGEVLDTLEQAGVLISVDNKRWIQFRHHLLFDFAAAQVLLDPTALITGSRRFSKADASGLMLAPALTFVLREIWLREPSHSDFWTAAAHLLANKEGDPIIRSATGRICGEYPSRAEDMTVLAQRIVVGDELAVSAFTHICGAFAIRLEDYPETNLAPWVGLINGVAQNISLVSDTLRFLLFSLSGKVVEPVDRAQLGTAARALLEYAYTLDNPQNLVSSAIELVAETYDSSPVASQILLVRVFEAKRLSNFAVTEVPAICRIIEKLATLDPSFGEQIYRKTYGFEVASEQKTSIGKSQILPLTSTARQDYDMARYSLIEFIEVFLKLHPDHAISTIIHTVDAYVAREHSLQPDMLDTQVHLAGRVVSLREDRSFIWAHDPNNCHGYDEENLIGKLLSYLRSADLNEALNIIELMISGASLAIFWSRLFLAASERNDALINLLLPIACCEEFLTLPDTRKDAVDVVAKGYEHLSVVDRKHFEAMVTKFDFSLFQQPDDARLSFERRLFGAIGKNKLATDHARAVVEELKNSDDVRNDRLWAFQTKIVSPEPYYWIKELDHDLAANQLLMASIERTKNIIEVESESHDGSTVPLIPSIDTMEALAADIDRGSQNPLLINCAEDQVVRGIEKIIEGKYVPRSEDDATTERFLCLLNLAIASDSPIVHKDTEEEFERTTSWGSPAPRVDAAKMVFDLTLQRPDLYQRLEPIIDCLLEDHHPAVRLQATLRLVRIWDLDRQGFWRRLTQRLANENNKGVIDNACASVLSRIMHADPEQAETLLLALHVRFAERANQQCRMRDTFASLIAILWVTYGRTKADTIIKKWIAKPAVHYSELSAIISTLREAFVAGLTEKVNNEDGVRHRSQSIAYEIVGAANLGLRGFHKINNPTEQQSEQAREYGKLLDKICLQLFFASGAGDDNIEPDRIMDERALSVFFSEIMPTLEAIGYFATPHTVHHLLQLLEHLLQTDPVSAFDLTTHALRSGGQRAGYQFDPMGANLLVKLVGVFLADYKELFENNERRVALIDCLEIFMDAGWPAARRLLYRLPELIQ